MLSVFARRPTRSWTWIQEVQFFAVVFFPPKDTFFHGKGCDSASELSDFGVAGTIWFGMERLLEDLNIRVFLIFKSLEKLDHWMHPMPRSTSTSPFGVAESVMADRFADFVFSRKDF